MLEHAAASPRLEVCGLLGGRDRQVRHYYPVQNIADTPQRAFYMSPQEQLDAMQLMIERGEDLLGIFHSHPEAPASPSASDLELAHYPGVFNFIVSMRDNPEIVNCFRYNHDSFSSITVRETYS